VKPPLKIDCNNWKEVELPGVAIKPVNFSWGRVQSQAGGVKGTGTKKTLLKTKELKCGRGGICETGGKGVEQKSVKDPIVRPTQKEKKWVRIAGGVRQKDETIRHNNKTEEEEIVGFPRGRDVNAIRKKRVCRRGGKKADTHACCKEQKAVDAEDTNFSQEPIEHGFTQT